MTYVEVLDWIAYRDKHGCLNPMRRNELSSALIAFQVNRGAGGKADLADFMPYAPQPALTLEQAMQAWN